MRVGGQSHGSVAGLICAFDLLNHDAELSVLPCCTPAESGAAHSMLHHGGQSAILTERPLNMQKTEKRGNKKEA